MVLTPQQDIVREQAADVVGRSEVGIVTNVTTHTDTDDRSNHEANVKLLTEDEELRRIPIHTSRTGSVSVPQPGDVVAVQFLGNGTGPYVAGFTHNVDERAPLARRGHVRHKFGESAPFLFIEAEPADGSAGSPDTVRVATKQDGLSDPDTEVTVNASGSTTDVQIDVDGDVTINADSITIGEQTSSVAVQQHTHDVTVGGDSGTTSTPNESGTDTQIE